MRGRLLIAIVTLAGLACSAEAAMPQPPQDELTFMASVMEFRLRSRATPNALAAQDMSADYDRLVKPYFAQPIKNWHGKVVSIEPSEDGGARVLLMVVGMPIYFGSYSARIPADAPFFKTLKTIPIPSTIIFSGRLLRMDIPANDPFNGDFDIAFTDIEQMP
jgi:hypothetical protein